MHIYEIFKYNIRSLLYIKIYLFLNNKFTQYTKCILVYTNRRIIRIIFILDLSKLYKYDLIYII